MPIGITEEHVALHDAVRGWVERHCPPSVPRPRSKPSARRCRRSGPTSRRRAGSACTSTRPSAARATASPSSPSSSRSWGARWRPARSSPTVLAARGAPGARARKPRRRCSPGSSRGGSRRGRRSTARSRRRDGRRAVCVSGMLSPVLARPPRRGRGRAGRRGAGACCADDEFDARRAGRASTRRVGSPRSTSTRPSVPSRRLDDVDSDRRARSRGGAAGRRGGRASRSGASTPRPSTRRSACSSAGRSASSRA